MVRFKPYWSYLVILYGVQLGTKAGKNHLLLGFMMAGAGVVFLVVSYLVWVG